MTGGLDGKFGCIYGGGWQWRQRLEWCSYKPRNIKNWRLSAEVRRESRNRVFLRALQRNQPRPYLDFGLLAPRSVRREKKKIFKKKALGTRIFLDKSKHQLSRTAHTVPFCWQQDGHRDKRECPVPERHLQQASLLCLAPLRQWTSLRGCLLLSRSQRGRWLIW